MPCGYYILTHSTIRSPIASWSNSSAAAVFIVCHCGRRCCTFTTCLLPYSRYCIGSRRTVIVLALHIGATVRAKDLAAWFDVAESHSISRLSAQPHSLKLGIDLVRRQLLRAPQCVAERAQAVNGVGVLVVARPPEARRAVDHAQPVLQTTHMSGARQPHSVIKWQQTPAIGGDRFAAPVATLSKQTVPRLTTQCRWQHRGFLILQTQTKSLLTPLIH